jgi:manganese oxidase
MNQMGHGLPNLIGVNTDGFDKRARKAVPGYMTMGETGMGDMGEMGMKVPRNSLPMIGAKGPHDYITMGGMATTIKVRDNLESYDKDPGWYETPPGTRAETASADELKRDLGFVPTMEHGTGTGGHQHGQG